ncbi:neuronal acetylcholine receptor subunit alpha-10-like isoform X1 [Haliotis rubra]|uniref:neuronal acetylcholine receptor subunit alpha-10-like isoform X1 n=1 Tax=Haliotis rubra TaxID=36100 RepID=UPI001EE62DF7|nr:neuronal acetylcholine receptor subunit alpha-10-like isoform X1 [Haliotis rubra]
MQIDRSLLVMLIACLLLVGGARSKGRHRRKKLEKPHRIPDEQKLLRKLLEKYDPYARPVYNASKTVVVKFGLTLIQIADMDEVNQVLTINVWLEQEWQDERLVWDPKDFNGLQILRIPCEKIWLPDIVLYNSADDFTTGYMKSKAMVTSQGNVFWPPPAKFRSSCKIDITYFPFDDQICELKFGSWTYDGLQVDLTNRSDMVDLENYIFSGEWQLLAVRIKRTEVFYACCKEPYPDVRFTVIIRRKTLYYLFNIIFPCLWLTILSLLGFWLPPDSGEKITLGITVLLAFSVFMLLIAENMPATSEFVPLIGIYLTVTMAMTSLSIILTVFVLQLHHVGPHQKPVPRWLRSLVFDIFARLVCMCHSTDSMRNRRQVIKTDDVCLSTFMETIDGSNCNGSVPYNGMPLAHERMLDRGDHTNDRITSHLKGLVRRQDSEERHQDVVNEWRFVAHVIDRLLFWIFLIAAVVSSITILVIQPFLKPEHSL